jgi:1,4-dihydroxy-2-naphthoate octaprenyltransferase
LRGIWRVADPKITLASVASMLLGGALAAADGPVAWEWLLLTVIGIFLLEAGKNASGEIFDFDSGADTAVREDERSPFSGGKRIIVDGLMTRREAAIVAAVFYALGILIGLSIMLFREPAVFWVGMTGVGLAYFYHAPPLQLSYRGWGEVAVALAYGPVITCGTYLVQRNEVRPETILTSLPLGIAIAAFLVINEVPDARADEQAGKRTWVVRLGRRGAISLFGLLLALAFGLIAILPALGASHGVWLGFIGLPHAVFAAMHLRATEGEISQIVPAQKDTLLAFLLTAVGMGLGILLAGGGG